MYISVSLLDSDYIDICSFAAVGKPVLQVTAFDKDSGSNGEIIYSFAQPVHDSSNKVFDVNQQTGEIILKAKLDREDIEQHILYIKAEDKGSPKNAGMSRTQISNSFPFFFLLFLLCSLVSFFFLLVLFLSFSFHSMPSLSYPSLLFVLFPFW